MPEFIFDLPSGSESSSSGAAVTGGKIDHRAAAVKRLPKQWRDSPVINSLLEILVAPAQDLEDTLWTLAYERTLEKAVELALDDVIDLIGKLVGEPRDGKTNADYARFINARIAARRSHGLIKDVIKVARLVLDDAGAYVQIANAPPACVVVRILETSTTDEVAAILIEFLKVTVSAGVRVFLEWSEEPTEDWFTWDTEGMGFDDASFVDATDGL
jgi:hypothetical protein